MHRRESAKFFEEKGYNLAYTIERKVLGGKSMIGFVFTKQRAKQCG